MKYSIDFHDPKVLLALNKVMIANTPVAYIILDKKFRVHFINDYFLKLRKLTKDAVLGRYCYSLSNNGVPCQECAVRQAIATGQKAFILRHDILPDKTERYIDDYAIPLYNDDEVTFDYILEIMHNRTDEMLLRHRSDDLVYEVIKSMIAILESKDKYTSNHSADVSAVSMHFARFLGLNKQEVYNIGISALLHDIGKVFTPNTVLNKSGKLTDEEFDEIKKHPANGAQLLGHLERFSFVKELCRHHHEKWDGTGYPSGLKADTIPIGARVISIADTYDAMTSDRSYRKGLEHPVAANEIMKYAGTQFDPQFAASFYEFASNILTSRNMMTQKDSHELDMYLKDQYKEVFRELKPNSSNDEALPVGSDMEKFLEKIGLATILDNSPIHYSIVGEAFDVLFVSKSLAESINCSQGELIGRKCFEINDKNMNCFAVSEHGCIACPTVRAFHTNVVQTGRITEKCGTVNIYMDIMAVPIEITDNFGKSIRCVMEIFFDRTREVEIQSQFERDIKSIMLALEDLIKTIDPAAAEGNIGLQESYTRFADYISSIGKRLKQDRNKNVQV